MLFIPLPSLILAISLAILTIIFSSIARFGWNPDKTRQ
ncbi:1-acyl-sn-glycerol-3-phosphate acyltransferase, partial [Streptococcus pneumoniae]